MKPFRFAYALFNPEHILSVYKEQKGNHLFVTVRTIDNHVVSFRVIDELEQEGTLSDFLRTWEAAVAGAA